MRPKKRRDQQQQQEQQQQQTSAARATITITEASAAANLATRKPKRLTEIPTWANEVRKKKKKKKKRVPNYKIVQSSSFKAKLNAFIILSTSPSTSASALTVLHPKRMTRFESTEWLKSYGKKFHFRFQRSLKFNAAAADDVTQQSTQLLKGGHTESSQAKRVATAAKRATANESESESARVRVRALKVKLAPTHTHTASAYVIWQHLTATESESNTVCCCQRQRRLRRGNSRAAATAAAL